MLAWIREKFGNVVIGGIIGFIAFVFVFYGVFSPKSTRGLHEGSVAGTVNGDSISISEFSNALNQRIEFFKNISGGKLSEEQIKAFKVRDSVFKELANRKLLSQESKRIGLNAADQEIREKIMEMPVFQKDGKFDLVTYKQLLEKNNYNPGSFERLMGDDLAVRKWSDFFKRRTRVADQELRNEYSNRQEQRTIKYVMIDQDPGKKGFQADDTEIKKFVSDPAKLSLIKTRFEQGKNAIYKGQKLEVVQEGIARDLILGEKLIESQKNVDQMVDQIVAKVANKAPADADLNRFLKPYNVQVKSTGSMSHENDFLPGVGEAKELLADAFNAQSPIELATGGKAKKYQMNGRTLVAWVNESKKPNWDEFKSQREKLMGDLSEKKFNRLFEAWVKELSDHAKIEANSSVVNGE
jgi:hypothetical protein